MQGLGFKVSGLGFRVWGWLFAVQGPAIPSDCLKRGKRGFRIAC